MAVIELAKAKDEINNAARELKTLLQRYDHSVPPGLETGMHIALGHVRRAGEHLGNETSGLREGSGYLVEYDNDGDWIPLALFAEEGEADQYAHKLCGVKRVRSV